MSSRLVLAAAIGALSISCTSARKFEIPMTVASPVPATLPSGVKRLWKRKLTGYVTDLSISRNGKALLVATAPNRELEYGARDYFLSSFATEGGRRWQIEPDAPVRVQALSDDAGTALAATYDEKLVAFNGNGRVAWSAAAMCKPFPLTRSKRIVCFHDDDAEPQIGFDVFNWSGKKLLSFPVTTDALVMKVSDDERNIALGLAQGSFTLFGPDFRALWTGKVTGEILDLDVLEGSSPLVAALYLRKPERRLAIFDSKGGLRGDVSVEAPGDKVEFADAGRLALVFGNHGQGADLVAYSLSEARPAERWHRREPRTADTPAQFAVTGGGIFFSSGGKLQLLSFDGTPKWAFDSAAALSAEEGASIYALSWAESKRTLAVATDDGTLGAFQMLTQ